MVSYMVPIVNGGIMVKKRHSVDIKKESVMGGGSSIIIMEIFLLKITLRVVSMTILQENGMKMGLYILKESTTKGKIRFMGVLG